MFDVMYCGIIYKKMFKGNDEFEKTQARKLTGLTQESFAPKVGLTKNGYALYETARREPSISTLVRISKELQISVDWLLGLES